MRNEIYSGPLISLLFPHIAVCWLLLSLGWSPSPPLCSRAALETCYGWQSVLGVMSLQGLCAPRCVHAASCSLRTVPSHSVPILTDLLRDQRQAFQTEPSWTRQCLATLSVTLSEREGAYLNLHKLTTSWSNGLNTGPWFCDTRS